MRVNSWIESQERFKEWRTRNPGVYIGLSPEGQKLVWGILNSYKHFIRRSKQYPLDIAYYDRIFLLLSELPPKDEDDLSQPMAPTNRRHLF